MYCINSTVKSVWLEMRMLLENWGWIEVKDWNVGGLTTGVVYSMFPAATNPIVPGTYEKLKIMAACSS